MNPYRAIYRVSSDESSTCTDRPVRSRNTDHAVTRWIVVRFLVCNEGCLGSTWTAQVSGEGV